MKLKYISTFDEYVDVYGINHTVKRLDIPDGTVRTRAARCREAWRSSHPKSQLWHVVEKTVGNEKPILIAITGDNL